MKIWITKYIGTMGLIERDGELSKHDPRYVYARLTDRHTFPTSFRLGGQAFTDRKEALAKAAAEIEKKRASLKKQLAKLDKMSAGLARELAKDKE